MNASSSPPPSSPDSTDDEPPLSSREKHISQAPHFRIDHSPSLRPISNSSPTTTSPSPPSSPSTIPTTTSTTSTTRTVANITTTTSIPSTQKPFTLPRAYRITRYSRYFIILSILLSFITIFVMLDSFLHHQRDVDGCQDSFMQPVYLRQSGFDSEMTRFASKYALYLYREKDVDLSDQPTGVPVLFIPGHAGSHKQIRSIAAETAYAYYQHYATHPEIPKQGVRNLDFFTVDFHEEFSALHGQSLLEQAEYLNDAIDYILKLYPRSRKSRRYPDPTSVLIIGHSMGGVVARSMFMINNYQPGSINTIITLSTPHILPPAPFDWKISKIYDDMHRYWVNGYNTHSHDLSATTKTATDYHHWASLKDVMLISIAGGTLDNIVCSDSANVGAFIPASNGFTVFTTAVPQVWTGTDHLSIYSCKQLVRVLAKSMLDIVDTRRATQTKSLEDRMAVMKKAFLSGLEDRTQGLSLGRPNHSQMSDRDLRSLKIGERLVIIDDDGDNTAAPVRLSLLPRSTDATAFSVLTDQPIGVDGSRFSLVFCNMMDRVSTSDNTRLVCQPADEAAVLVPASTERDNHPFSGRTFSFASVRYDEMKQYQWFGVMDDGVGSSSSSGSSGGFLIAESFNPEEGKHKYTIDTSMLSIAMKGVHVNVKPALFSSIHIPSIESPMLAYHLKVSRRGCSNIFAPFLRQSISTMHESKFYVNLANSQDETDVSLHGRTAFSSMAISTRDVDHRGLSLQVWMDPTCGDEPLKIDLAIDWYGSAGRIGFRNGIMLLAYAFIIVMFVIAGQIYCYNKTGIFPHFGQGLSFCIRRTLPVIIPIVALCSIYQCTTQHHLPAYTTVLNDLDVSIAWHDLLIGNSDPFFWWLPIVGLLLSLGAISFVWLVVELLLHFCASISSFLIGQRSTFATTTTTWRWCNRANETRSQKFQRRAITTLVLFVMVATCIPYQFVFVVAVLVHIISCIRSLIRTWAAPLQGYKRANRYHYMQSLLLLMITLLPFNLPILVVWIRNLSVHWFVPFSSDHNVFAIAPFILYVELLTGSRKMLPRTQGPWHWGTCILIYGVVAYTFLYGIKYTHSIYFLSNHMMAWFLLLHARDSHYGRMTYRYVADHVYPFRSKKHS
ncbi:PGAP1-like protein-domain-containing protein [Zychaea mexicana]|uniref:PGAP1-like protein-domain-containing protein n=1 Tax=Zychaea mexicana TaxID=64656 RepID=UPI0022FDD15C|nr:PGAP1-like protein-domain-containing protein [Zychaea mexicana]KAI9484440.1 PGAP1-like protein-domain-containing protein [Zychaea mexicana]